ncbi:MAG: carotenoid biosynthesis protein [Chlorobi bacterium]|nr:carotenoid biosynthesis protein [Chlorobiota bacterium]
MKWIRRILATLFAVLLIGGSLTTAADSDLAVLRRYGEMLFLWVAAAVIVVYQHPLGARLALGAAIGLISEIVGVAIGIPFGRYHYTETLGPAIAGVPIVMVAAWLVLLSYAWTLAMTITQHAWRARVIIALAMTMFDLLIDPVAIGPMRLWVWEQNGIYYGVPLLNFIGWLGVSFLAAVPLNPYGSNHAASHIVGVAIIAFFTVIAWRSGIEVATLIGGLLLAFDGIVCRRYWMQYFAQWVSYVPLPLKR